MPLLALAFAAAQPVAPPPAALTATGSWRMQAEETACILSRAFGDTTIGVRPVFDTDEVELFVVAPERLAGADVGPAQVTLGGGTVHETPFWITQGVGARPIARMILPATALAAAVPGDWTVTTGRARAFRVTGVAKALATLADCQRALVDALGLTLAMESLRSRPAINGAIAPFFGANAYPSLARDRREQGLVRTRLLIGKNGEVLDCRTTKTESAILSQQTCAIAVQSVQLRPARDRDGKTVASTYGLSVRWALPQ